MSHWDFSALAGNDFVMNMLVFSDDRLTRKMRLACFKALLQLDMGFFDERDNVISLLTTTLAIEAQSLFNEDYSLGDFLFNCYRDYWVNILLCFVLEYRSFRHSHESLDGSCRCSSSQKDNQD